jgi:NTP pyrophosphatase (non-canonical NTP hydrolase)
MDVVNNPKHYASGRKYEPIDILEAYFPQEPLLWQVIKYCSRFNRKSDPLIDLKKAEWYLSRKINKIHAGKEYIYYVSPVIMVDAIISDWFDSYGQDPVAKHVSEVTRRIMACVHQWTPHTLRDGNIYEDGDIFELSLALTELQFAIDMLSQQSFSKKYDVEDTSLTFDEYQDDALLTAIYPNHIKLMYPALGLCGEAGEVAEKIKKLYRDTDGEVTQEFKNSLCKELGDVLWYVSALSKDVGLSLNEVAFGNLAKLADRQSRGKLKGDGDER